LRKKTGWKHISANANSLWNSFNEQVVSHVRHAIEARLSSDGMNTVDPVATLKPFMTVEIETLNRVGGERGDCWSYVARFEFITDGLAVQAGIWVEGSP
jgi:hypothetical protein